MYEKNKRFIITFNKKLNQHRYVSYYIKKKNIFFYTEDKGKKAYFHSDFMFKI